RPILVRPQWKPLLESRWAPSNPSDSKDSRSLRTDTQGGSGLHCAGNTREKFIIGRFLFALDEWRRTEQRRRLSVFGANPLGRQLRLNRPVPYCLLPVVVPKIKVSQRLSTVLRYSRFDRASFEYCESVAMYIRSHLNICKHLRICNSRVFSSLKLL